MTTLTVIALTLTAAQPADAVRQDLARLEGTWKLVSVKEPLSPLEVFRKKGNAWVSGPGLEAARRHVIKGVTFTFKGDRMTVQAPKGNERLLYWFKTCSVRLDPSQTPKAMDLTPLDKGLPKEERRTFGAIYMLDGDALWMADFMGNADRPLGFDLDVGIQYPLRVFVLRRERLK